MPRTATADRVDRDTLHQRRAPRLGEHRAAMQRQRKSLIGIRVTGWGPIVTGGFPPELADKD